MPKLRVLLYYVDIGDLYTGKIKNLETVQVPNNYSAGCSLHGDVATQVILVGAHTCIYGTLPVVTFLVYVVQYRRTSVPLSVSLSNDLADPLFDGVGPAGFKIRANALLLA